QATFLILARKADTPGWRQSIAGWLYCVAYRLARRARQQNNRRRRLHAGAKELSESVARKNVERKELSSVLDEELHRLGEHLREPLLLCYLEGKTRDQAAQQLGWSLRTLERRLQQGLKLLRARLGKRRVDCSMALLTVGLSQQAAS